MNSASETHLNDSFTPAQTPSQGSEAGHYYHICPNCQEQVQCELVVMDEEQLCKLLRISSKTARRYRQSGKLSYCKYGARVVYLHKHLTDFLNSHEVPAAGRKYKA